MNRVALILILCLLAVSAEAATRYASTSGSGSTCSSGTPCSLTTCVTGLAAGDTCYLKGGTYTQGLNANNYSPFPTGTSWSTPVTIASAPNETAILKPNLSCGGEVINLFDSYLQYIVLDRLIIDATDAGYAASIGVGGAHHIRFQNGELRNAQQNCPLQAEGNNRPNVLMGGGFHEILRSRIHSSRWSYGMYLGSGNDRLIEDNDIYNNGGYGIQIFVSGESTANSTTVRRNRIYGNGSTRNVAGLTVGHGNDNLIYNNVIYNNPVGGIDVFSNGNNNQFYNNTLYNNGAWGFQIFPTATNAIMKNNIIYQSTTAFSEVGGGTYTQTNNLCSSGCAVSGNPGFVSAAGGDFHIAAAGSPAVNAGATLGSPYNVDIEGKPRPAGQYTIGAYQFASGGPPPNPFGNVARWSFDEGSGTTAADSEVGTGAGGHTCTMNTAGWVSPGIIGASAFSLNGSRRCLTTLTSDLKPPTNFGFSAWVNTTDLTQQGEIVSLGDSAALFKQADGTLSLFWYNGSTWTQLNTSTNIATGTNHHVAGTKDDSGLRIWVDGAQVGFLATTGTISYTLGTNAVVGEHGNGGGRNFIGTIDQVYIYDTFFDQTSVENLRNENAPVAGMTVKHMAWYAAGTPGVQLGSIDANLSSPLTTPLAIRWALQKSDTGSLTEYFRPFCIVNTGAGFPAWTSAVELTNSFGSLGARYYADAAITQGQAASVLLPTDGFTGISGKILENPIDTTSPYDASQRMTLAQGQHAELQIQVEFGSPLVATNQIRCRPHRESGTALDDYGGAGDPLIKTLTIQGLSPPSAARLGGSIQGGTLQ